MTTMFTYDRAIAERYPRIRAGVICVTGVVNGPSPPRLLEEYRAEQRTAAGRLDTTPIPEIPSIGEWRRAFTSFGVKPTQHRSATEALLRRLQKVGDIPTINTLADIGNLVSIRHALPVAAFDQATVVGGTTVRFSAGKEQFTDLGSTDATHPEPGEVIFVDDSDIVSARRWCWRQSAQSATGPNTVHALFTVESLHDDTGSEVESAVADLESLLATYQPQCEISRQLLSPASPTATFP